METAATQTPAPELPILPPLSNVSEPYTINSGSMKVSKHSSISKDPMEKENPTPNRKELRAMARALLKQAKVEETKIVKEKKKESARSAKQVAKHQAQKEGQAASAHDGPIELDLSKNSGGIISKLRAASGFKKQSIKKTRIAKDGKNKIENRERKNEISVATRTNIRSEDLTLTPIDLETDRDIPTLSHQLDRVLFNPGVCFLQDPRSRVYNFDPYLQNLMSVADFNFDALADYITSSRDTRLEEIAKDVGKKYIGSTSSMTAVLAHFHFLLSCWRPINTDLLSQGFPVEFKSFSKIQRLPAAIILNWKDGVYAIDSDKEFDIETVLSYLGRSMEKLLTQSPEEFEKYRKGAEDSQIYEDKAKPEFHHYTTMGDFLMRSQIDAKDSRLPGTGTFDLKTRAVAGVRHNINNPLLGAGYQIKSGMGQWESFEREYYDMMRSAFLKYSLQVRMGRMDGIYVAYHNTERMFGFQYISIDEMDKSLHGGPEVGEKEFKLSLKLLNEALDLATEKYPEQSLRIHFECRDGVAPFMYIAAEPVTQEEINNIQTRKRKNVEDLLAGRPIGKADKEAAAAASAFEVEEKELFDLDGLVPNAPEPYTDKGLYDGLLVSLPAETLENSSSAAEASEEYLVPNAAECEIAEEGRFSSALTELPKGTLSAREPLAIDPPTSEGTDLASARSSPDIDAAGDRATIMVSDVAGHRTLNNSVVTELIEIRATPTSEDTTIPVDEEDKEDEYEEDDDEEVEESEEDEDDEEDEDEEDSGDGEDDEVENPNTMHAKNELMGDVLSVLDTINPSQAANEEAAVLATDAEDEEIGSLYLNLINNIGIKSPASESVSKDIFFLTLKSKNKINDFIVARPDRMLPEDRWSIDYEFTELQASGARDKKYTAILERRKSGLEKDPDADSKLNRFSDHLQRLSASGRLWLEKKNLEDEKKGVEIWGKESEVD